MIEFKLGQMKRSGFALIETVPLLRKHFPLKTVEDVAAMMPGAKLFSKLDATSGFWQTKPDD